MKAGQESFTEDITWKKIIWGKEKQSTQSSKSPQQTQEGQPPWEKVLIQRTRQDKTSGESRPVKSAKRAVMALVQEQSI